MIDRDGIVRFDAIGTQQWQIADNKTVLVDPRVAAVAALAAIARCVQVSQAGGTRGQPLRKPFMARSMSRLASAAARA